MIAREKIEAAVKGQPLFHSPPYYWSDNVAFYWWGIELPSVNGGTVGSQIARWYETRERVPVREQRELRIPHISTSHLNLNIGQRVYRGCLDGIETVIDDRYAFLLDGLTVCRIRNTANWGPHNPIGGFNDIGKLHAVIVPKVIT